MLSTTTQKYVRSIARSISSSLVARSQVVKSFGAKSVAAAHAEPEQVQRVYEKQRRDFVYEAALLLRFNQTTLNGAKVRLDECVCSEAFILAFFFAVFAPHFWKRKHCWRRVCRSFATKQTFADVRFRKSQTMSVCCSRLALRSDYVNQTGITATIVEYVRIQLAKFIRDVSVLALFLSALFVVVCDRHCLLQMHDDVDANWSTMLDLAFQVVDFMHALEFGIDGAPDDRRFRETTFCFLPSTMSSRSSKHTRRRDPFMLCDWKVDQFALATTSAKRRYQLRLIDVDSLAPYVRGTKYLERQVRSIPMFLLALLTFFFGAQMCDVEQSPLSACVGEFGCFRNSYRVAKRAPNELFCNRRTRLVCFVLFVSIDRA